MVKRAKPLVLCDTNIFLDYYRDQEAMLNELDSIGFERLAVSTVTVGEVFRYMKNKESSRTKYLLNHFSTIYLSKSISLLFAQLMFEYKAYHPAVADCLIAATAITYNAQLYTFNRKHFSYYQDLTLYNPSYAH